MSRMSQVIGASAILWLSSVSVLPRVAVAADDAEHDHTHATVPSADKPENSPASAMMQQMQAMHEKMMAAESPAERQALMAEHMKLMQDGMKTIQQQMGMTSGKHTMSAQVMQQRMDMMTMMMQMMMDRQGTGGMSMGMKGMNALPATPGK